MDSIDLAVIGSGPSGLTAAIYAVRNGLKAEVFENKVVGGTPTTTHLIENYTGFTSITGEELAKKMAEHAKELGVKINFGEVKEIKEKKEGKNYFELDFENKKIEAKAILLATGTKEKELNVKGEKELKGKGVSYCPLCDGFFFKGKRVAVIGGGNSGAIASTYLSEICREVILITNAGELSAEKTYLKRIEGSKNVKVMYKLLTQEILGKEKVEGIKAKNTETGKIEEIKCDGVFIRIGVIPNNGLAKNLGIKLDKNGFIEVNERNETSLKGVFASGDIAGNEQQIIIAAGDGAKAAINVFRYLKGI
ncbi:MAG: FAD-dependent oxidoreductase [archaeon]|nr:FAD-dependent oxidoreductase [Candidatus Micrarchaeota archaeon]